MCLSSEGIYCPIREGSNSQKCGKSDLALKKWELMQARPALIFSNQGGHYHQVRCSYQDFSLRSSGTLYYVPAKKSSMGIYLCRLRYSNLCAIKKLPKRVAASITALEGHVFIRSIATSNTITNWATFGANTSCRRLFEPIPSIMGVSGIPWLLLYNAVWTGKGVVVLILENELVGSLQWQQW
jgi:hypothetical protein